MAGFYYTQSGYPLYNSQASSTLEKAEFQAVQAGFDKLPTPTGFPNAIVKVKADQSGLTVAPVTISDAGAMAGIAGVTLASGTWDLTGALVRAATAAAGTNTDQVATTAFVTNQVLTATLPGQAGNSGKFLTTDGTTPTWAAVQAPLVSGTNIKTINGSSLLGSGDFAIGNGDVSGPAGAVDGEIVLFSGTTGKAVKRSAASGLVKLASGVVGTAVAGTDYQAAVTATGVLKGSGSGTITAATAGTDYQAAVTATGVLKGSGAGTVTSATAGTDFVSPSGTETLTNKTITGTKETRVAMAANNIDLSAGNYFTKTISGATTLTVSNVPASGTAASFILDLTNGGSAIITWWSGVKWVSGTAPALSATGRDVLGFFTHDAGSTWTGLVLGKDVR